MRCRHEAFQSFQNSNQYDDPAFERADQERQNHLNPLVIKTGGLNIADTNFFVDGIGKEANSMIAGYYLISYIPPPGTFEPVNGKDVYHRVKVNVKRTGAAVYTREGFYSRQKNGTDSAASVHPLQAALFSPFLHSDINVNLAVGYVKDVRVGYLVRAWIHIDPKDATFVETKNGGAQIALKMICLTSDAEGVSVDTRLEKYVYTIEPEKLDWVKKYGIRFSMLLPVKKPGVYTVRIGVQDVESEKIGSAYQVVEIPAQRKDEFVLSSIFMITSDGDLAWMNADATKQLTQGLFFTTHSTDNLRTPVLKTYKSGDSFQTLAIIYNADAKALARNDIVIRSVLFKDGEEFLRGEPKPITMDKVSRPDVIPVSQKLTIGKDMPPGNYVLQLLVIDKRIRAKEDKPKGIFSKILDAYIGDDFRDYNQREKGLAYETLNFRVTE